MGVTDDHCQRRVLGAVLLHAAVFGECRVGWRETTSAGVAQSVELGFDVATGGDGGVNESLLGAADSPGTGVVFIGGLYLQFGIVLGLGVAVANPGLCGDQGYACDQEDCEDEGELVCPGLDGEDGLEAHLHHEPGYEGVLAVAQRLLDKADKQPGQADGGKDDDGTFDEVHSGGADSAAVENEDGPVYQVQRVGDVAEVLQGRGDQQSIDTPAAVGAACHDDERAGEHGPECQVAGECSFDGENCAAGDQTDNADPAHDNSRLFGCFPLESEHCQQSTDGKFPEAGAGVKVGESLVGVGFNDGEGQGCDEHRVEDKYRGGEEVPAESAYEVGYCCEEQGPDDENLSLDGERPEVLEW